MKKPWLILALAGSLLLPAATAQKTERAELLYRDAVHKETVQGDLKGAIAGYQKVVARSGANRTLAAQALMRIGQCYEKLGNQQARTAYERLVRDYADQGGIASQARSRLAALVRPRVAGPAAISFRQAWTGTGAGANTLGSPSPDARYLSFADWTSEGALTIHDMITGLNRRVTDQSKLPPQSLSQVWESHFSPDGKQVAYLMNADDSSEIRVVGVDGSGLRTIYKGASWTLGLHDWSPDGRWVLATQGAGEVVLIAAQDGKVQAVRKVNWAQNAPMKFSPDGRFIAYDAVLSPDDFGSEVRLLSVDGSRDVRLTEDAVHDYPLGWSSDGRYVLLDSDRTGNPGIWAQAVAAGTPEGPPRLLKSDAGMIWPLGVSGNGAVFYEVNTAMVDVYVAEIELPGGRLLSAPQLASHRFVGTNRAPHWSSDGRLLLYNSKRPMAGDTLVIQDMQSGKVREIRPALKFYNRPSWRPDGSIVVWGRDFDDRWGFYSIDSRSGAPTLQVPGNRVPDGPRPDGVSSADGAIFWVYSADAVYRLNLQTGTVDRLFSTNGKGDLNVALLSLSPDGNQLAFQVRDDPHGMVSLRTMPASGGSAREISLAPIPELFRCCRALSWTPDSKFLLGSRSVPGSHDFELWLVPVDGTAPRRVDLKMPGLLQPHLHPDGRHVAFVAGEQSSEVWVMENLLSALGSNPR